MKKLLLIFIAIITVNTSNYSKDLTVESLHEYILEKGIMEPNYVLAQACEETGWLKSYNCRHRNNLFGFRSRKWVTPDNKQGYKVFDNWESSVEYYRRWQIRKKYKPGSDYLEFLKTVGYAENPLYESNVASVLRRLQRDYNIK